MASWAKADTDLLQDCPDINVDMAWDRSWTSSVAAKHAQACLDAIFRPEGGDRQWAYTVTAYGDDDGLRITAAGHRPRNDPSDRQFKDLEFSLESHRNQMFGFRATLIDRRRAPFLTDPRAILDWTP